MTNAKVTVFNPWGKLKNLGDWDIGHRVVRNENESYRKVPLLHRAVQLRCNMLTRVPVYVYEGKKIVDNYIFEDQLPLYDLFWKTEASILLKGNGFILKNSNEFGFNKGLQWLNPFTIYTKWENNALRIWQEVDGQHFPKSGSWGIDDFLWFYEFNPNSDYIGLAAATIALADSQTSGSVSKFLAEFFGSDAIPVTMVIAPENTETEQIEKLETWFKKKLAQAKASVQRVIGIKGDIKVEKLTNELRTFDFDKIDTHSVEGISDAFDIPQSLLRSQSGANKAISDNERESFINDTIIPRCNYFESMLNPFLEEFGQRIEFVPEEMPEMQEDEVQRSDALGKLVDAGVPLDAALDILGYDLSDEAQASLDAELERKEEARNKPPIIIPNQNNLNPNNNQPQKPENIPLVKTELDKWLRKALSRIKLDKSAKVEFESDILPQEMKISINNLLESAKTEDCVRNIFKETFEHYENNGSGK